MARFHGAGQGVTSRRCLFRLEAFFANLAVVFDLAATVCDLHRLLSPPCCTAFSTGLAPPRCQADSILTKTLAFVRQLDTLPRCLLLRPLCDSIRSIPKRGRLVFTTRSPSCSACSPEFSARKCPVLADHLAASSLLLKANSLQHRSKLAAL